MTTFFSGTDTSTLQKEGNERNCFVSLIVNNAGEYNAAVTRKVQTKSEVTVRNLGQSYEFFGDGEVKLKEGEPSVTKTVDSEMIEYYMLDVERHAVDNPLKYLDERFEEIQKKKQETKTKLPYLQKPSDWFQEYLKTPSNPLAKYNVGVEKDETFDEYLHKDKKKDPKQLELFEEEASGLNWAPDPDLVEKAMTKIVTCSLIINPYKFNLAQWVENNMERQYALMFNTKDDFGKWKEFAIDFFIDYLADETIPEEMEYDMFQSIAASALRDALSEYYDCNDYMREYYDMLSDYIFY